MSRRTKKDARKDQLDLDKNTTARSWHADADARQKLLRSANRRRQLDATAIGGEPRSQCTYFNTTVFWRIKTYWKGHQGRYDQATETVERMAPKDGVSDAVIESADAPERLLHAWA